MKRPKYDFEKLEVYQGTRVRRFGGTFNVKHCSVENHLAVSPLAGLPVNRLARWPVGPLARSNRPTGQPKRQLFDKAT